MTRCRRPREVICLLEVTPCDQAELRDRKSKPPAPARVRLVIPLYDGFHRPRCSV